MTDYNSIPRVRLKQVHEGRMKFPAGKVSKPSDVYAAVLPYYKGADREMLGAICLDAQNKPTNFNVASVGSLNTTRTRPAEILKVALLSNALGLILTHNHPSGELEPSPEDLEFTRSMKQACELMGVELYDHLVVTDEGYTSFRERGLL